MGHKVWADYDYSDGNGGIGIGEQMKYALVNGERLEAQPGLSGECPGCNRPMVARCGEIRIPHWAHSGKRVCDPWWENETEWHRTWKGHFLPAWQERIHEASDGEKHIADVKTDKDWVLEFQHSLIKPDERRSRNNFYQKLAWVVNGLRRKRDHSQFLETLSMLGSMNAHPFVGRICIVRTDDSALIRDWVGTNTPVFFDFGDEHVLWCLLPKIPGGKTYVVEFSRKNFIEVHRNGPQDKDLFAEVIANLTTVASEHSWQLQAQAEKQAIMQAQVARMRDPLALPRQFARPRRHFRF